MAKKTLVNTQTDQNVTDFIKAIPNTIRKADSEVLVQLMSELTGEQPKIWGKNIIGFGKYSYARKNGDEFEWFTVGFSPAKAHLSVYFMYDVGQEVSFLKQLGPHKHGKGCLYIKKLADIDLEVLKQMILKSEKWQ